ncbi:MAG: uvrD/rep helicase, partial [Verrucomicrobiales bacterium]|nr:uvrD/rep helicase [Verrucomicrobiales bacterium]
MSREYVLHPFRAHSELQIDYAKELNEQQYAAVTATPGPALVIAGAGSGKTRTLTYRVAFLLEQGIPAERILLLTFTNKAAREMMRRVSDLLSGDIAALWGGTFHSIGHRMLRRHAALVGFKPDFSIMDREDSKDLIDACIGESQIDTKATLFPKGDVLADIFSMAVNTHRSMQEIVGQDYEHFSPMTPGIVDVHKRYEARKRSTNAVDFDDLLVLWLKVLQDNPDVCESYQKRFQFILVDEYQDTNKLQADLIDLLGARHKNVMVVGDDSQSIYSWRGANFQNIIKFPDRYPGARTYKIETNYRSTPEILKVANSVIAPNIHQFEKQLVSARKSGNKPVIVACGDGYEQAAFVAQRMLQLNEEGISFNEMAVLYRSHFHAMELQMELTKRGIPFSITSGMRFFEQAHIKDVAAYLKLAINPSDELSFKRLIKLLPGIGNKGAEKLWVCFRDRSVGEMVPEPLANRLQACRDSVPKKAAVAWAQFVITLSQLESPDIKGKTPQMIELVMHAVYEDYLKEEYANFKTRIEDVNQLVTFSRQFENVEDFLAQLALMTNLEAEEDEKKPKSDDQVRLSTIHQAKG